MAGLDRSAKVYNTVHARTIGTKEITDENRAAYRAEIKRISKDHGINIDKETERYLENSFAGMPTIGKDGSFSISPLPLTDKMANVLDSNVVLGASKGRVSDYVQDIRKSLFKDYEDKAKNAIALHGKGFFNDVINSTVSHPRDISIQYETVARGYNISQTSEQAYKAIQNAKKNGFVSWDLETMAGNTILGPKRYPGPITQFAFASYDNTGKQLRSYDAIIGATDKEVKIYEELLGRLKNGTGTQGGKLVGDYFTDEEVVTLHRLQLAGNKGTKINRGRASQGILSFESFAGKEDLPLSGFSIKDVERGINVYKEAAKIENITKAININGITYNVRGWENELLSAFQEIFVGGKTALGFNSREFDIHRLKQLVASGRTSKEFDRALKSMLGGKEFDIDNHLDMLPIFRQNVNPNTFYSVEDQKWMAKMGLSEFTQEALTRKITSISGRLAAGDSFYERIAGSAHDAAVDLRALATMAIKTGIFGEQMMANEDKNGKMAIFKNFSIDSNVTRRNLAKGDILHTKNFADSSKYGLMMFFEDPDTGAIMTSDDLVIDRGTGHTVENKFLRQTGAQRGVNYEITGLNKIKFQNEDDVINILKESYPNLASDQLYTLQLNQFGVTGDQIEDTSRSRGTIRFVGTIGNLQRYINNNFLFSGHHRGDGTVDYSGVGRDIVGQLAPIGQAIDDRGIGDFKPVIDESSLSGFEEYREKVMNYTQNVSNIRAREDAAARMNRKHSLSKDKKLLALIDTLNAKTEEVVKASNGTLDFNVTRRQLEEKYFKNSVEINKMLLAGKSADSAEVKQLWDESLHATIGFSFQKNEATIAGLYPATASAQLTRMHVLERNRQYIDSAIEIAERTASGNQGKANYTYKKILSGVNDYLTATGKFKNAEALGYLPDAASAGYMYEPRYEINLRGFKGIQDDTIFNVYTSENSSPSSLVRRLVNKMGGSDKYRTEQNRALLFKDLQEFLASKGKIKSLDNSIDEEAGLLINRGDSSYNAALKLMNHMVYTRTSLGQEFGHIHGTGKLALDYGLEKSLSINEFNNVANDIARNSNDIFTSTFGFNRDANKKMAGELFDIHLAEHLFGDDTNIEKLLADNGYSEKDISNLKRIRNIKKADIKEYVTDLFASIGNVGGDVAINKKTGKVQAIFGDTAYDIQMISSRFEQGQFVDRIGNRKVSLGFGIYKLPDEQGKMGFRESSVLAKFHGKFKGRLRYAENRIINDYEDPAKEISKILSGFYSDIGGKSPGYKSIGTSSRFDQFRYSYEDVIENIDMISDKLFSGKYDSLIKDNRNVLHTLVDKSARMIKDGRGPLSLDMDYVNILAINSSAILAAVQDNYLAGDSLVNAFTNNTKFAYEFLGTLKDGNIQLFSDFGFEKRKSERFSDSRINGRSDAIAEILKLANSGNPTATLGIANHTIYQEDINALTGISLHGGMMTADYRGTLNPDDRLYKNAFREARMKVLHTDSDLLNVEAVKALESITKKGTLGQNYSKADIDMVTNLFMKEGHAYMHGQVFDRFFNDSESLQMIENTRTKVLESKDGKIYDFSNKAMTVPKFTVNADGTVNFTYGRGSYVRKGEDILSFKSQDKVMGRQAKYSGLLKFGYFDNNNNLIGEDKIARILSTSEIVGLKDSIETYDGQRLLQSELEKAGLTGYFYVQAEDANPYKKLTELKEKNMTVGMIEATGAVDKRVDSVLRQLGFKGIRNGSKLDENRVLNIDLIDSITSGETGDFWTVASHRYRDLTGKNLDKETYESILTEAGFDADPTKFHRAVMKERYRTSELMEEILIESGMLKRGEHFHLLTDHAEDIKKHKDLVSLESIVNNLLDKNINEGKAKGKAEKEAIRDALENTARQFLSLTSPTEKTTFSDKELSEYFSYDVDNKSLILKKRMNELRLPSKEAIEKLIGKDAYRRAMNKAEFVTSTIRAIDNYEIGKFGKDTVKANQRTLTAIEQFRYSDRGLKDVKRFLEHTGREDIFDTLFMNATDGQVVHSAAVDQIKKHIFDRGDDKLAGFMGIDADKNITWGLDKDAIRDFVERHEIGGLQGTESGINTIEKLITSAHKNTGAYSFSEKGTLDLYKAYSNAIAVSYNMGNITAEEAEKAGFQIMKLHEINFEEDGRIADTIAGKNILVDLEDTFYGTQDNLKGFLHNNKDKNRRFLAVAYTPRDVWMDTEDYISQPQKYLHTLQIKAQEYRDALGTKAGVATLSEEGRVKKLADLGALLEKTEVAQYNQFMSKKGIMNDVTRAWLPDGSYNLASGLDIISLKNKEDKGRITSQSFKSLVSEVAGTDAAASLGELEMIIGGKSFNLMREAENKEAAVQFSYTIMSLKKMHQIYDKNYNELSSALLDSGMSQSEVDSFINSVKGDTLKEVQTRGVHGISYREPTQYFGSVTQRQIYFNDIAKGNQAIGNFTAAEMRKEDYDSDKVLNAIHKEAAQLEINGHKLEKAVEIDSAMYEALKRSGVNVHFLTEGAEERFTNYEQSQLYLGSNQAQKYRRFLTDVADTYDFSSFETDYLIKEKGVLDDGRKALANKLTLEDARKLHMSYFTQIEAIKLNNAEADTLEKQRMLAYDALNTEAKKINGINRIEEVTENISKELFNKYRALKYGTALDYAEADIVASSAQAYGAGMVNSYTQTMTNITQRFLNNKENLAYVQEYYAKKGTGITAGLLSEQMSLVSIAMLEGSLTPKNEERVAGYYSEDKIKSLKESFSELLTLYQNPSEKKRTEVKQQMSDYIFEVLKARYDQREATRDPALKNPLDLVLDDNIDFKNIKKYYKEFNKGNLLPDGTYDYAPMRQMADTTTEFLVDVVYSPENLRKYGQGIGTRSKVESISDDVLWAPYGAKDNLHDALIDTFRETGSVHVSEDHELIRKVSELRPRQTIEETISELDRHEAEARRVSEDIVQTNMSRVVREAEKITVNNASGLKHSGLLGAAIGLAGGLILSGFANDPKAPPPPEPMPEQKPIVETPFGNAPLPASSQPQPTDMLAAGADAQMPAVRQMSLADSNLNVMRGNKKRSYIINISGDTDRSRTQAIQALNSAMYRSGASQNDGNGNINMAVNNNYRSSLTQAQVNRMVQDSLIA